MKPFIAAVLMVVCLMWYLHRSSTHQKTTVKINKQIKKRDSSYLNEELFLMHFGF
jgi:hypothetical protein